MQSAPVSPKSSVQLLTDRARRPDREAMATLSEVFAERAVDGAAVAFALGHLPVSDKPVMWVQDRLSRREAGRPCLAGLPRGLKVILVDVARPVDVLWAMEQSLGCPSLAGVVGEVWGDAPAVDFTATKRLALRSEAHRVPAWLIRRATEPALSAARDRWRVRSLPSLPDPHDIRAPGQPLWRTELFRSRWRVPGDWVSHHDGTRLVMEHGIDAQPDTAAQTAADAVQATG